MEARLRLASEHTRFAFGLDDITAYLPEKDKPKSEPGENKILYTLGIKSVDANADGTAATLPLSRKSEGWREGTEKAALASLGRDLESRGSVTPEEKIEIFRAGQPFLLSRKRRDLPTREGRPRRNRLDRAWVEG